MKSSNLVSGIRLALLANGVLLGTTAFAQSDDVLEEIIVTAQKIEQRLVEVPISMTVLDSNELEAMRVVGVEDYALTLPNVTYVKGSRDGGPDLAIRGVSGYTGGAFSPINVTVDDIPYAMIDPGAILTMRSFDLERVELLRGPQGTLTGANGLGGILSLVTAKPNADGFTGDATVDYGRYNYWFVRGMLNVPLGDTFAVRGVVFSETGDGVTENKGPAGGSSSVDSAGARVAARWTPTENLTVDASYTYEDQEFGFNDHGYIDQFDDGPNETSARRQEVVDLYDAAGGSYMNPVAPFWDMGTDNNRAYIAMDFPEGDEFKNDLASFHAAYDLDKHTLNFIYGYYTQDGDSTWDADRTEMAFFAATVKSELEANSAELRINSNYAGPFNWVAGLAYQNENSHYEEVGYTAPAVLVAWGDMEPGDVVGDPNDYSLTDYAYVAETDLTNTAAFANVFYDITDRLHLSAGLRYTDVDARFGDACCGDEFASPRNDRTHEQLVAGLDPVVQPTGSSDEWNPRIALSYDLTADSSVYGQYSTGFRPGTANDPRIVGAGYAGETAEPEYMANYEVGYKATLLDSRLFVGLAAFYMDYSDLQVGREAEISVGGSIEGELWLGYTVNAGKANVTGMEAEAIWQATDSLRLRAGVGYADSVVEEFDDVEYDPALDMPGVRPWTTSVTAEYDTPIGSSLSLGLRGEYRWQDDAWYAMFEEEKQPGNYLPSFQTLDLSATLDAESWSLQAYYENVLDEQYYTGQTSWSFRPTVYFMPRTYGARFIYRFGEN